MLSQVSNLVYENGMKSRLALSARLFVVFALTIAMATSGFAHKVVTGQFDESIQDYVAAGGSLDDLCGELGLTTGQSCDACRLVDQVDVPTAQDVFRGCIDVTVASRSVAAQRLVVPSVTDPARPVRAPPVV